MKKKICCLLLATILLFALTACGGKASTASKEENATTETNEPTTSDTVNASTQKGSRSNPYKFGEDILITTTSWGEENKVKYTVNFSEMWGPNKISSEYSDYRIEDRILLRGSISVSCDETDDGISFDLYPVFMTDTLNEESAHVQTYKNGELNNLLTTVYSGGQYEVIVLGSNDGISSMTIPYLKISYRDIDGQTANVWVALPETIIDTPVEDTSSIEEENVSSSEEEQVIDEETTQVEAPPDISTDELNELLLSQPMYVERTEYVVQDEQYKTLYPDMLQAVVKNNSGTDVKNVCVAFVAWDANGFPVKIATQHSLGSSAYVVLCNYEDANMVNGSTYGDSGGLPLDRNTDTIAIFKAIVVSYDDFDGNTWDNPYYDTWRELYSDKKLN